jgi:hypothetical protein
LPETRTQQPSANLSGGENGLTTLTPPGIDPSVIVNEQPLLSAREETLPQVLTGSHTLGAPGKSAIEPPSDLFVIGNGRIDSSLS